MSLVGHLSPGSFTSEEGVRVGIREFEQIRRRIQNLTVSPAVIQSAFSPVRL